MKRISLFVLLDGVGWRQIHHAAFLERLCPHRKPLKTILGYSCGAVPTILSGKMPAENDHWAMWFFSPKTSPFHWATRLVAYPRLLRRLLGIDRARLVAGFKERNNISGYCEVYQIPDALLPLMDTSARNSLYRVNGLGRSESIFDLWSRDRIPYGVYGYPVPDLQSLLRAADDIRRDPKGIYFLHLYETDAFLHRHCSEPDAVNEMLIQCAQRLEELYHIATQVAASVDLTIFSDHGMTPVTAEYDLIRDIEGLGLAIGRDYVPLYDSTMARFWFFRSPAEERIGDLLRTRSCGRILSDPDLTRLGIFFPDRRYGQLIFLMKPGWVINPSYMGAIAPAGMHGFHPEEDPWADAILLSTRPIPDHTRHIVDLFGLMQVG